MIDEKLIQKTVSLSGLLQKGDSPFVYLFCYGALMDPAIFKERLEGEYADEGIDINVEYDQYFAGMYSIAGRQLSFTKNKDGNGRGHVTIAPDNLYVIGAMMIVPKSALRYGSDLNLSEGCFSSDGFAHQNHYTLVVNTLPFRALVHEEIMAADIEPHNAFYYVAGYNHVSKDVKPDREYIETLIRVLKGRVNEGWEIPTGYINSIVVHL